MKKFISGSSNDLSQLSLSTFTNFHNLSLNFISRPLDVDDEVTCLTLTQLAPRFHFTKKKFTPRDDHDTLAIAKWILAGAAD